MNKTELEPYRRRLLELKRRLGGDLSDLEAEALRSAGGEASGGLSNVPVHPADLGTDTFEEELTLGLLENEQQIAQEVLNALDRIDQGTYGRCENCGKEISRERLQALPYTRYCIRCARQLQAQGGE